MNGVECVSVLVFCLCWDTNRITNHRQKYDVTHKIMKKIMVCEWIILYDF